MPDSYDIPITDVYHKPDIIGIQATTSLLAARADLPAAHGDRQKKELGQRIRRHHEIDAVRIAAVHSVVSLLSDGHGRDAGRRIRNIEAGS
jgi:hypothetical protein